MSTWLKIALLLALIAFRMGAYAPDTASIGIIGGADGPTSIIVSSANNR